ncbi:hypothetical protein HMPREF9135_0616 [Segatella baroniae F0067]|uniref:Uncharacterized protein n=1 Tax=Segatella baroniae F0067 TaxID=1115809 RepID=U2QN32_9BACT|nr:hypothetical protein HMPREF9135_0616 [Segatella baroniae F0067]
MSCKNTKKSDSAQYLLIGICRIGLLPDAVGLESKRRRTGTSKTDVRPESLASLPTLSKRLGKRRQVCAAGEIVSANDGRFARLEKSSKQKKS